MMIFLYILSAILLLIIFILSLRIKFSLTFDGNLKFSVGILFVKLKYNVPILYKEKKVEEETEYVFKEKRQTKKKGKKEVKEENTPSLGIKNTVIFFKESVFKIFEKAIHSFRLERLHFKAVAASDDAAKTAELYGVMCTAGAAIHQFAENAKGMKKNAVYVEITPDFLAEIPDFYADLRFSIRIWRVLKLAFSGGSIWINYKKMVNSLRNDNATLKTKQNNKSSIQRNQ